MASRVVDQPHERPLRVAHVLRKLDVAAWGGTETHVAAISRHLAASGVTSEVHAPRGPEGASPFDRSVSLRRFEAYNPFLGSAEARKRLWQTGGNIISLEEPARLIADRAISLAHLHTMGRIGGGVRAAMRLTGRPYVVSIHGPLAAEQEFLARETQSRLRGTIDLGKPAGLLFGARRVLDDAARVIVFNEGERRALEGRLGDRVVRMDHGVDLERFASGDAKRALFCFPELAGKRVVLQVARLSRQKDQETAVAALASSGAPDLHLVLVGAETDEGYASVVRTAALRAGVADRVIFLGNVAPTAIPDLLALAELVIVPSAHEAFGLAVIEAWAAERPVLFSRVAGMIDIAANLSDDSVALPPGDAEAWGAAIAGMARSKERRAHAAAAGLAVARGRYDWRSVAASLAQLYRTTLARPVAKKSRSASYAEAIFSRGTPS